MTSKRYYQKHKEYFKEKYKHCYKHCYNRLKKKVFEKYGNKCAKCGITDFRVLQIDHINGNGSKERKELNSNYNFFNRVLGDNKGNYQLLCANCNWIKKYENKEIKG